MERNTRRLNAPGKEHLVVDNKGHIVGLYCLDVDKLDGIDSWEAVDQAVKEYAVIHPNETKLVIEENAIIRNGNYNKFGSGKSKTIRHGVNVPPGLFFKLQRIMPDLFENPKKLHTFMHKYKGFLTCEAI